MFSSLFCFVFSRETKQAKKGKRRLRNGWAINCPDDKWRWCYQNSALKRGNAGQQQASWGSFPFAFFILLPQRLHGEPCLLKREVFVCNSEAHLLQTWHHTFCREPKKRKVTWEDGEMRKTKAAAASSVRTASPFHGTAVQWDSHRNQSLKTTTQSSISILLSGGAISISLHYFDNWFM